MDPIRIGVIGSGGIFRNLHVPYLEQTKLGKIVAVADMNEESAREMAQKFSADAYTDYRDVLKRKDVDAVEICTHPRPHCKMAVAAAKAKKHILIEKPMCCSVGEGNKMIAAAKKAKVKLQVAYMMRFNPNYMKLKELLDNGTLGKPHMIQCDQVGLFPPKHPWLFIQKESGGMLIEQAIHIFDEWLWLYGPAESVYARTSHVPMGGTYPSKKKAVQNNAVITVNFKSGATAMHIKSWASPIRFETVEGVVCSKGSAKVSQTELQWQTHDMEKPEVFSAPVPDDDTYRNVPNPQRQNRYWAMASKGAGIEHWLKCILGEEKPTTDGKVGRDGIAIAEAAYRSARKGKPVKLPLKK
ncbi:MAG: Gfo/Idh/MocA family oxidoreductase [Planctomycetes bacterium]|nr:Gfo/Idh/MocA family oxidoreductase [Planctomycetota bacterium]